MTTSRSSFNFQELLEFTYLFQCDGVSASALQDILGCSSKTAKDLQVEVARLEPGQVISRSPRSNRRIYKVCGGSLLQEL
jgi:hypothetical protein